jgi:hypothetical protein
MPPHTPGPWKTIECDGYTYLNPDRASGEYALIARMTGPSDERIDLNADRIVACINALAGLDPSALADLVEAARLVIDRAANGHLGMDPIRDMHAALDKLTAPA